MVNQLQEIPLTTQALSELAASWASVRLPQPVSSFIGRSDEVAELAAALLGSRLVTLTGPSGIGKTRLALEVASRLEPNYPDGAWLVDLAPLGESGSVPQAVARALDLPPGPGRPATERVIEYLRSRRCLLVLDNCEHVLEASSQLVRDVVEAAPDVSVLATSQRALATGGEHVVPVPPMSLPDARGARAPEEAMASEAVALFCARVANGNPQFRLTAETVPAVVEICRRLDGIPLAIELAAARAAVIAPTEIAERLQDRFRLLTRGASVAPPRHQTLRAALDWSYELLSPAEAALLRRLSVFAGGANLRAVEAVCAGGEVDRDDVLDLVTDLVARSLVTADTSGPRARYRLLETVRHYGRERLEEDAAELGRYAANHVSWCVGVAEDAWHQLLASNRHWVDTIQSELDNVRAALDWAADGHRPELGLRLATAMTPFCKLRGDLREGQEWLERALRSSPNAPPAMRARALWSVGMLAVLRGEVATATSAVEESLELARAIGFDRAEAEALNLLGFISIFTQDPVSAMPLLEESVALAREVGDSTSLVNALALYGRAHLFLGDVEAARGVFEECLRLASGPEDEGAESALIGLGWTAIVAGEQARAKELFSRVLPLVRAAGEHFEIALVLSFLGGLAGAAGELAEARALLEEGLALAQAMGAPFPAARCLCELARVALSEGDSRRAEVLVDEGCELARRSRLPYALVRCLQAKGTVRRVLGDADGAEASFEEALVIARDHSDNSGVAGSLHQLARMARDGGNDDRSIALHIEAIMLQADIPDAGAVAGSLEALAGLAVAHGRHTHAARLLGAAKTVRVESGSVRPPDEQASLDEDFAGLFAALERSAMEEAWAEGACLSLVDAVAQATKGRGSRDRPSRGLAALTPAERQVVDLAAAGLTNIEIGEKLFVSPRTVQGHLLRAFPKLGVKSRRQLREVDAER